MDSALITETGRERNRSDSSSNDGSDSESDTPTGLARQTTKRQEQINAAWNASFNDQAKAWAEKGDTKLMEVDNKQASARTMMANLEFDQVITTPREYQMELFERAKKENVIAVLPTGSGKTLIAVLLIQHMIEKELEDRGAGHNRRISFFLVEVATLVFQQSSVLRNNLSQQVAFFCGEMNIDSWSKATWKGHFDSNMVIVMTAEVLYNCLSSGFITMQEINLLILDEAHHAKKNHPYARIMRDFFRSTPENARPRIFGTTASPVDAKTEAIQAAVDLERMLSSKIATVKNLTHLYKWVKPPKEIEARYKPLRRPYATPLCSKLEASYKNVKLLVDLTSRSKILTAELGEWCGNQFLVISMAGQEGERMEARVERQFASHPISQTIMDKEIEDIKNAKEIVATFAEDQITSIPSLCLPDVSTKVLHLKELLNDAYDTNPDTRCIVFVERRASARLLLEVLRHHRHPYIKAGLLIGARRQETGNERVSISDQFRNMKQFKDGNLNLLLATSVAEEGLDIPMCNLVIRFDLYKTMIQYMQSRGRARHEKSTYIHMLEEGNPNHFCMLRDVQEQERLLRAFCENQPPDRILESLDADLDQQLLKYGIGDHYTEPSTGAKLLFGTVLGQLAYFADCLPQNDEAPGELEFIITTAGRKYLCEVLLPPGSPIRSATGKEYPRKSLAKRSAAFEACFELRKRGFLDSNLLPIYHKQLPVMRNALLALGTKAGSAYNVLVKPAFWSQDRGQEPTTIYGLLIAVEVQEGLEFSMRPMLLLTRRPLPQIPHVPTYPSPGQKLNICLTSLHKGTEISKEQLLLLNAFTLRVFKDVFNKTYENNPSQISYWLAPANTDKASESDLQDLIDWKLVETAGEHEPIPWEMGMDSAELENRFLIDPWDGGSRYYSIRVEPTLQATEVPPEGTPKKPFMNTIVEWTSSLRGKHRQKVSFNPDQPVLLAYKLPLRRNTLIDWNDDDLAVKTKVYICPEPLKISLLPRANVAMFYALPALIYRIDSCLIALEACNTLGIEILPQLALEAVTKDSYNTEEGYEPQLRLSHGMGKNYERLEFLGDAFLKMASSISLYIGHMTDDEFNLHVKRMLMICNKNLLTHALERKLYQYIRTEGFNRRTWYPEGLILLEGKGALQQRNALNDTKPEPMKHKLLSQHLGDKTIADVCEALIGASLLTGRLEGSMDPAVKAVTVLVNDLNHQAEHWTDYSKQYQIPSYQTVKATASQLSVADQIAQSLGYTFKYPRLLASAFTHPSWPSSWGHVPSYQRLEFLGDSLFDMVCINFLFHGYPNKDPQWLTEHKMAMVSNKFLGALCVKLDFHRFLKKNSSTLIQDIKDYVEATEEAIAESAGAVDYWTDLTDPPKCLADIVEAYIGAIFVDSNFDFGVVEAFFEAHIKWFFQDIRVYDTFTSNHPTTLLSSILTQEFQCHEYSIRARKLPPLLESDSPQISAGVMIHLQVVTHDIASTSRHAKVQASTKAIEMLKQMTLQEFRARFKCTCKVAATSEVDDIQAAEDTLGTAV